MFFENRSKAVLLNSGICPKYISYGLRNFNKIPQLSKLSKQDLFEMQVVGTDLPFKVNNYVIDNLIDWDNIPNDPIFRLVFPQKEMLSKKHFNLMADAIIREKSKLTINSIANIIRMELNPHPAGQADYNIPILNDKKLEGIQHKYNETVLFFPSQGQTCHAYCTFCFRWPQFTHIDELRFSSHDVNQLIDYLQRHKEVTDLLITGGDPMIMHGKIFKSYIDAILDANIPNLHTIRIGSKSLAYWPYKFVNSDDAYLILKSFEKVVKSGRQLSFMAQFNHPVELETDIVKSAIRNILATGAKIRTQSPIIRHINDDAKVWEIMWKEQVRLGCIPYYMFMARDTGAKNYFKVSLIDAWQIFRKAYMNVGGNARTVSGPVMSCGPGKIQMLGINEIMGNKVMVLRFLQGRNKNWVQIPFFAKYNEEAYWIDDLEPTFDESKFFFESELEEFYQSKQEMLAMVDD
jgi:KamA family protein